MRINITQFFLLEALKVVTLVSCAYRSSQTDRFIYDDYGRVSFFHGENFVQKGAPWYPEVLLDESNIEEMHSWGFNTVRLGVMWSGIEPAMGVFNDTYLGIIGGILDDLYAHDMTALIDVHQDVLSSYFCLYDGAPTWLVDLSNSSTHEFPWPLVWDGEEPCTPGRPWGANYLAEATGSAFQDLYDNVNGMREHFGSFWTKVAETLRHKPNILGYEIINEPWAGDIYSQPSLLLPGIAGARNLQPFYDSIAAAIRAGDPEHLIFYEPVTWGMIFNGTVSGSGFTHVPGGPEYANKSVFSFHYYCWWYEGAGGERPTFQQRTCDRRFGPKVFQQALEESQVLGGSAMLTEWGQGCTPSNGGETGECNPIMDLADEHLLSWIDWYWTGNLMNNWDAQEEAIAVYSRTYAKKVAGVPSKMKFDADSKRFQLCYTVDPEAIKMYTAGTHAGTGAGTAEAAEDETATTVIYANFKLHYPNGASVHLTSNAKDDYEEIAKYMDIKIDADRNEILIVYTGLAYGFNASFDCCVHIAAK